MPGRSLRAAAPDRACAPLASRIPVLIPVLPALARRYDAGVAECGIAVPPSDDLCKGEAHGDHTGRAAHSAPASR